jgi:NADPH:quinone reductase-like Zn-dependent oxidoreductase
MMRAIVQGAYGSADVLRLAEIARPGIAAAEVLVEVRAAGLDRGTWHFMTGKPYVMRLVVGLRKPRHAVPGRDVAGTGLGGGRARGGRRL